MERAEVHILTLLKPHHFSRILCFLVTSHWFDRLSRSLRYLHCIKLQGRGPFFSERLLFLPHGRYEAVLNVFLSLRSASILAYRRGKSGFDFTEDVSEPAVPYPSSS